MASTTAPKHARSERSLSSMNLPRKGLLMIISPAKTFDLSPLIDMIEPNDDIIFTQPDCCIEQTIEIARSMKQMSKAELTKALKLSPSLSNVTKEYWSNFEIEMIYQSSTQQQQHTMCKPCIFMYSGAAYQGISIRECDIQTILYMQDNLRILDAVYGVLRPLDQIQPYRLEMDTKGVVMQNTTAPIPKLSTYWSKAITNRLISDLNQTPPATDTNDKNGNELPILLNLASEEYSAAIDMELLIQHCRFMKVIFYEEYKIISVHAKRARGLMVRYVAETHATTLEEIQQFNREGYQYIPNKSTDTTLVFNRPKNYSKPSSGTTKPKQSSSQTNIANKRSKQR